MVKTFTEVHKMPSYLLIYNKICFVNKLKQMLKRGVLGIYRFGHRQILIVYLLFSSYKGKIENDRQTDRQIDGQIDRQIDIWMDRWMDKQIARLIDKQTDIQID